MSADSFIPHLPVPAATFPYSPDWSDAFVIRSQSPAALLHTVVDAKNGTNTQGHIRWVNGEYIRFNLPSDACLTSSNCLYSAGDNERGLI